jgi:hypothetical protein
MSLRVDVSKSSLVTLLMVVAPQSRKLPPCSTVSLVTLLLGRLSKLQIKSISSQQLTTCFGVPHIGFMSFEGHLGPITEYCVIGQWN